MLLAGDEFGRSQMGNNNGYCQDSEISWVHWDNLPETANALREFTRHLIPTARHATVAAPGGAGVTVWRSAGLTPAEGRNRTMG